MKSFEGKGAVSPLGLADKNPKPDVSMKNRSSYSQAVFVTEQTHLPESFVVVTAYNPNGVKHTHRDNRYFNTQLEAEIKKRLGTGPCFFEITGQSICGSHKELGWGIDCSVAEGLELGALFKQEAIFWINERRQIYLVDVKTRQKHPIAKTFEKKLAKPI